MSPPRAPADTVIEETDPERRSIALALLGALGGAVVLQGCDGQSDRGGEAFGSTHDPLSAATSVRWCDTMTEQRAVKGGTGTSSVNVCIRRGYETPADGGGGIFVWTTDITTPQSSDARGGLLVVPTGTRTGAWKRLYSGPINVRWFGVKGDNLQDDTAALQSVFATLLSAGAGFYNAVNPVIYMPKGVYRISGSLAPPAGAGFWTLRGDGPGQTVIAWTGTASPLVGGQPMLLLRNARTVTVEDLRFSGNGGAKPSFAIEFRRVSGYTGGAGIGDCKVFRVNVTLEGPHIDSCIGFTCDAGQDQNNEQAHISDCWFENYTGSGVAIQHLNSLLHTLTRCTFGGVGGQGFAVDTLGGPNSSVANMGGSFSAYNCASGGHKAIFRFGPGNGHTMNIHSWSSEPETHVYEFPFAGTGNVNIINEYGSEHILADVPNHIVLNQFCDVRWFGVTASSAFGVDYVIPAGARLSLSDCLLVTRSIINAGTLVQRGCQARLHIPIANTGQIHWADGGPYIQVFGDAETIDLAGTYMFTAGVAGLNFSNPTTLKTLKATRIGQTITLVAYGSNVTIENNAGIRLAGDTNFSMGHLASLTLVSLDAPLFGNAWVEVSRKT